jgi:hypothetical protein
MTRQRLTAIKVRIATGMATVAGTAAIAAFAIRQARSTLAAL